jgi:chromosome segregation ATPase
VNDLEKEIKRLDGALAEANKRIEELEDQCVEIQLNEYGRAVIENHEIIQKQYADIKRLESQLADANKRIEELEMALKCWVAQRDKDIWMLDKAQSDNLKLREAMEYMRNTLESLSHFDLEIGAGIEKSRDCLASLDQSRGNEK